MRPFTIVDCEQRTPEWFQARCGRVTGTCADAILAHGKKKGEESVQRRDLRIRKVLERITNLPIEDESRKPLWMQWGVDKELDGFSSYEAATGVLVRRTGFLAHVTLPIGCSLDGDVGDFRGLVSMKCPKPATHWGYYRNSLLLLEDYRPQVLHEMFVTGAEYTDLVSFDPRFPVDLQLVIRRVPRADLDLTAYELVLRLFLREVDDELAAMQALRTVAA